MVFLSTAGKRGAVQNSCSTRAETAGNEEGQSNRSSTRGREEADIDIALIFSVGRGWLGCYIIRGSSPPSWRSRASSLHGFHVAGVYLQVFNGLFSLALGGERGPGPMEEFCLGPLWNFPASIFYIRRSQR